MRRSAFLLTPILLAGTVAGAALPASWSGTWKLNASRSFRPGASYVLGKNDKGEYVWKAGTVTYTYRCDGKEYPMVGTSTHSCVEASPGRMESVNRNGGKTMATSKSELSADGRTLTVVMTLVRPNGAQDTNKTVYARMGGGAGFAGAWRNTDPENVAMKTMVTKLSGSTLRISYPKEQLFTDVPLNGSYAAMHGVTTGLKITLSAKPDGELRILTGEKTDGTLDTEGDLLLSPDGKVLIREIWRPGMPESKAISVYDRE